MKPLGGVAEVRRMIDIVKTAARGFGTNFFLPDGAIEPALRAGDFEALEAAGVVLFLKREAGFVRVYYCAADTSALADGLARLNLPESGVLVADIIGRPDDTAPWEEQFAAAGFSRYSRYLRMQRIFSGNPHPVAPNPEVEVAQESDAEAILDAITATFDAYADHIPGIEEIRRAASLGTILLGRDAGRLAAVLYYDRCGVTSLLRYWLVLPDHPRSSLGDKLMGRYFQECAGCRRSVLWVQETNQRAIAIYRWYGYKPDSTVDAILIQRP
ncbi:MAG: GNAT family N-acetyltransferase [Bryobacteraceae bacterium]